MRMKIMQAASVAGLLLAVALAQPASPLASPNPGQSSAASTSAAFEPVDRWKAAVLSGSQAEIAQLYTTVPPAQTQAPQGTTADPNEEARFWSALAGSGLTDFQTKILAVEHRQGGVVETVLRVGGKIQTKSGPQAFIVEIHQRWMRVGGNWQIFATRRSDPDESPVMRLPEPAKPNIALYAPPEDAQSEISTALAAAAKDRKRVILVFGANWCYDCHVLDTAFRSKSIAPLVNANYHVVHINVGDDGDQNLDLAESYGIPLKKAVRIPSLAVLDPDGKVVYSQKQGEFDDSTRLGPTDVVEFLKKWAPPHQG